MSARVCGSLESQGLEREFSVRQYSFNTDGREKTRKAKPSSSLLRVFDLWPVHEPAESRSALRPRDGFRARAANAA